MTDTQHLRALLGKRLEMVQEIARLNARELQNRQIVSGLELEVMLCERDLSQGEDAPATAQRLAQARAQYDATQARLADDARDLMEWHGQLDALDREISKQ
ncbi:hypothetical protein [Ancylobacter vacuolatus]|uniref:Uncharacterized protein n=1 Tax=Ancylobacter vacuolatus TaxID=223389 RepID=A0ABU0DJZ8_9HYPH|nr:hypothetical protein [Ancylobacter vacuolatus]MDQ0348753.1 hypothetical protein [Ancylobacter vacuolatus]